MVELRVYGYGAMGEIPESVYIVLIVLLGVGSLFLLWRKGLREGFRYTMVLLLVEWVFLIFGTSLLFRETHAERHCNLIPLWSYFNYGQNSYLKEMAAINLLNVMLFIPVGLLLGLGFREMTWKKAIMTGAGLSIFIELLQLIFKRGLCETDDVIHNVLGCIVGYGAYRLIVNLNDDDERRTMNEER
jgi:glycopeptide antibiotics resistance protein